MYFDSDIAHEISVGLTVGIPSINANATVTAFTISVAIVFNHDIKPSTSAEVCIKNEEGDISSFNAHGGTERKACSFTYCIEIFHVVEIHAAHYLRYFFR